MPAPDKVDSTVAPAVDAVNQGPVDLSKKKQRQLLKEQKRELASKEDESEPKASNEVAQVAVVKPEPASQKMPSTQPPALPAVPQDVKPAAVTSKPTASTTVLGLARARVRRLTTTFQYL